MTGLPAAPLEVGRVLGPHGLAGQVKLHLFNPDSPIWAAGERVYVTREGQAGQWLELKALRMNGGKAVATLSGVGTLNEAQALRGATLLAERGHLEEASPGEVFLADLIGCRLLDSAGRELGRLAEVRQAGSLEFFVVEGPFDILLPTQTVFASVDLTKGLATLAFELEPDARVDDGS
jgi:16S rRNA processing protein RimM